MQRSRPLIEAPAEPLIDGHLLSWRDDVVTRGWRRSRYCGTNTGCVDVRIDLDGIRVRDSKDVAGPVLCFSLNEWSAFVRGVRAGDFDTDPAR